MVQLGCGGPDGVEHHPPVAVGVLYNIRVAHSLEGTADIVPVGQNRISGAGLKGSPDAAAPGNGLHMAVFRAALGDHQIVPAVFLVHMGTFGAAAAGTGPDLPGFAELLTRSQVDLKLVHTAANVVDLAVVIPEERGVDALVIDPHRVGPFAVNVVGPDVEIAAATAVGGDHVEAAVVITDSGGVDAAGSPGISQRQLTFPGQNVADLLPVGQVLAVPQGDTGEKFKGTVDQIVIIAHTADAGIRGKTGYNGVLVDGHGRPSLLYN